VSESKKNRFMPIPMAKKWQEFSLWSLKQFGVALTHIRFPIYLVNKIKGSCKHDE